MLDHVINQTLEKVGEARALYHRLVLIVGPARSGKTLVLQRVSAKASAPLVNVNLELSRQVLE